MDERSIDPKWRSPSSDTLYNMIIRSLTGFWVPLLTYRATDDRQYPAFSYKRGREVQQVSERGLLLDLRTATGRQQELMAPRRNRYDGVKGQQNKELMQAEHISNQSQQIIHLLAHVNDELRHETGEHGDNTVDPDLYAEAKQSVHRLIQERNRQARGLSPEAEDSSAGLKSMFSSMASD